MVEEKKKRGRPKKIVANQLNSDNSTKESATRAKPDVWDWEISGNQRRDDLVVQMVMGVINKQGTIKYDFAKDLFNTATQLAYDFGWMEKPKEKKKPVEYSGEKTGTQELMEKYISTAGAAVSKIIANSPILKSVYDQKARYEEALKDVKEAIEANAVGAMRSAMSSNSRYSVPGSFAL